MTDINNTSAAAFEQAMCKHGRIVERICFYYAHSSAEYEDLRQDAMLNIWRGWHNFRADSRLSTWIYRVTLNTCISQLRKNSREPIDYGARLPELSDDESTTQQLTEMHVLINRLKPKDKAVLLMWLDEMPYEEIASVMGCSRNTVATWIRRAKEKLVKLSNS